VKGQVLEKVLFALLYNKSKAVVGAEQGTAPAPVSTHKRIITSKRSCDLI
jgi:hypothetical protein